MSSLNRVILIGNLTRDPEIRYSAKGTAFAKMGLAVNRKWKDQAGETREEVAFIDCDAFGRTAEIAGQYCRKGSQVAIDGRLKLDQWDDKQTGQKRSKLGVTIESLVLLGSRQQSAQPEQPAQAEPPGPSQPSLGVNVNSPGAAEDDVPF